MAELNPLRPPSDDDPIEEFDCGRDSMNAWLRRYARRNHEAGMSRVTVLTEVGTSIRAGAWQYASNDLLHNGME